MAGVTKKRSSAPKRRTASKPTPPTTVTGRRVKRRPEAKPTNGSKPRTAVKPKKTTKTRRATAPAKAPKPRVASTPKKASKPQSAAKRQVIPPATKATHRATSTTKKSVTFSLNAPTGSYVAVGGTFSNWEPQAMTKGSDGIWRITLLLARGMYQYRFQVDAQWLEDPNNPRNTPNDHGSFDSICEVL